MRLGAAERFEHGDSTSGIAAELRVTEQTVRRWRQAWQDGGAETLRSKGPVSRERLSPQQWARLEAELGKGRWRMGSPGTSAGRWAGSRR